MIIRRYVVLLLVSCGIISTASADVGPTVDVVFAGSGPGGDASLTLECPVEFEVTSSITNKSLMFVIVGPATGGNDNAGVTGLTFSVNGGSDQPIDMWRDGAFNGVVLTTSDTFLFTSATYSLSPGDIVVINSGTATLTGVDNDFDLPVSGSYPMFVSDLVSGTINSTYGVSLVPTPIGLGESIIQDENTNAVTPPAGQGLPIPAEPAPGDGDYFFYSGSGSPVEFLWVPNLEGENITVEVSWGVSFNHTTSAAYYFDEDGDGPIPEILLTENISQISTADESFTPGEGGGVAWSGFLQIGSGLSLNKNSVFRVVGSPSGVAPQALSTAVWRFSGPEPVPTLTEWGIFFLIVLLAGAAFLHVRKLQLARA